MVIAEDQRGLRESVSRTAEFFRNRETRSGVLARRIMGRPHPKDEQLVEHLVRERRRRTRMDGSVGGSLLDTAWTAWELLDLGCPLDDAPIVRTVGYILAQQDRPGHFAEGCSSERHDSRLCYHFVSGFFSPGTRDQMFGQLGFPSGVVIDSEGDARFAVSCLSLRVVLRAHHEDRPAVHRHLESLLSLGELWQTWDGFWSPDLVFFALGALALAPIKHRGRLDDLVEHVLHHQHPGGGWSNAFLFHALDMLLSVPVPAARDAVRRAAPLLCSLQQDSGAFDAAESEEKALIALRVLRLAEA